MRFIYHVLQVQISHDFRSSRQSKPIVGFPGFIIIDPVGEHRCAPHSRITRRSKSRSRFHCPEGIPRPAYSSFPGQMVMPMSPPVPGTVTASKRRGEMMLLFSVILWPQFGNGLYPIHQNRNPLLTGRIRQEVSRQGIKERPVFLKLSEFSGKKFFHIFRGVY